VAQGDRLTELERKLDALADDRSQEETPRVLEL
jgi:hypothetical protein